MNPTRQAIGLTDKKRATRFLGTTWALTVAVSASLLAPVHATEADPEIYLLQSTWEDAAVVLDAGMVEASVIDPAIAESEVEVVIGTATVELAQATDALDTTVIGPNPFVDTVLEPYYEPTVTDVPSTEDQALIAALDETEIVLATAEAVFALPGVASDTDVVQVNTELNDALESADALIAEAVVDATPEQLAELEQADDALNSAAAAITEVIEEDVSAIADLGGWVPSLRFAIDKRGPKRKLTGDGIDIAIIDSGITPVQGLHTPGKIINGPDLSADGANPNLTNLDLFGHGTHLAGIIAGNDGPTIIPGTPHFAGIAPDARLVNVKVADAAGNTSVEQIVAGIEWVIANRNANGMDIRVLNLSFGYQGSDRFVDPISAAVEQAWANGIVVVIAGGNQGNASNGLDNPAIDPFVLAVAGTDQAIPTDDDDDSIASWSSAGDGVRNPDISAPGRSIVSLRVPGSNADSAHPESRIGTRFAVASGTSQSSAVMAGTVALLLEKDPTLTPDQVKRLFTVGAQSVVAGETLDGNGNVALHKAIWNLRKGNQGAAVQQTYTMVGVPAGFGTATGGWAGSTWSGSTWSGSTWSGAGWSGAGWSGSTWSGAGWSGAGWSGAGWSGSTWSGSTWSGAGWSGAGWS